MTFPTITAFYAGLLALISIGLGSWVIAGRVSSNTLHGLGDPDDLAKRVRSHGNFIEHVPLALILIALLEAGGASHGFVRILLILLVIARIAHPFGMFAPPNSPKQFICRGGGIILTMIVTLIAAIDLLLR
jgi:uncharacterized membrane protein YecN with MAPEG domain